MLCLGCWGVGGGVVVRWLDRGAVDCGCALDTPLQNGVRYPPHRDDAERCLSFLYRSVIHAIIDAARVSPRKFQTRKPPISSSSYLHQF